MMLESFDIAFVNSLTLALVWWALSSRENKIANLTQLMKFSYQRQVRERMILLQAKVHLRTYAKAVSMVEMAGDERIVVTITMNTFSRDNLYALVGQLDDYSPDDLLADPTPQQSPVTEEKR